MLEAEETSAIVAHLESHLGPIEVGWRGDRNGPGSHPQVVRLRGSARLPGVVPYATLGVSRHALHSPTSGRPLRLELVMLITAVSASSAWASLLHQVAGELLASHTAVLRGEVIGPRGPLVPHASTRALYASVPTLLPDDFATCRLEDAADVALVWLIPITADEAGYVAAHGWDAFEDLLVESDADLTDPHRASVTHTDPGSR